MLFSNRIERRFVEIVSRSADDQQLLPLRQELTGTNVPNKSRKHGSASMLYAVLCVLAVILGWVFVQATHHTAPITEPDGAMHQK